MSDIVDILRANAASRAISNDNGIANSLNEAADEITRLREANKELAGALQNIIDIRPERVADGLVTGHKAHFDAAVRIASAALSKYKGELK